jgi:hypothetical protein
VLSGIVLAFARFLYQQQATSEVRTADLVGQTARVIVAIPAGGVGQVRCRVGAGLFLFFASSFVIAVEQPGTGNASRSPPTASRHETA